ncbi:ATP-binding protein [[Clostridium] polysaccharolyticum]|uniref:ATPase family associated with various cellular activities (AAA) n=1 Tax=[Clostridium] polysaccharolyticum TaxID=29364 RepID=A0A1I0CA67_9FIRM|nr:AAA family ATPase [[Clostridium] polysaccharolyticum]SET15868.1 ATPase family associated with various cellular activities (AAA) [[Clostridium] polysaccharolyticum]
MQLEELYDVFFQKEKEQEPYGDEEEFNLDMLRFLDLILTIGCSLKYLDGEGEPPLEIENAHLRGVAITGKEVVASLYDNSIEREEELPFDEIKEILLSAIATIRNRIEKTEEKQKIVLRMKLLGDKMALSDFERFMVLLGWANYMDIKYELIYSYLQGDVRMKQPSLRLAVSLYELFQKIQQQEVAKLTFAQSPVFSVILQRKELYDNIQLGETFTLSPRVFDWLAGNSHLSDMLRKSVIEVSDYFSVKQSDGNYLMPIYEKEYNQIKNILCYIRKEKEERCQILNIYGPEGNGKKFFVDRALRELEISGLFVDVQVIVAQFDIYQYMEGFYQECMLADRLPCFVYRNIAHEEEEKRENILDKIYQIIDLCKRKFPLVIWISEEKAEYFLGQEFRYMSVKMDNLSLKERYLVWCEFAKQYKISQEVDLNLLANQFSLSVRGIKDTLWNAELLRVSEDRQEITIEAIRSAVKQQSVSKLGQCATLIPATYTWDDLVISQEQKTQLELICNQVKYKSIVGEEWGFFNKTAYGRGVCALFYGAPGTGKTMAVQVIANELGLSLYRIDLSQLISKYVGETEKNISKVFERAKGINALLFFDEADSLFAKRLDVKDSMDRSANAQTAHLLQQMEDYDGITILATNLAMNLDDAFKRRIKFMIKFTYPAKEVRMQLWQTILPKQVPCEEELDLAFFAETFELSGSSIKEILTIAAFMAASKQRKLSNKDIVEAVKLNYAKYGKTLSDEDFSYLV